MRCASKDEGAEAASANLNFVMTTMDKVSVDYTHSELSIEEIAKCTTEKERLDSTPGGSGG